MNEPNFLKNILNDSHANFFLYISKNESDREYIRHCLQQRAKPLEISASDTESFKKGLEESSFFPPEWFLITHSEKMTAVHYECLSQNNAMLGNSKWLFIASNMSSKNSLYEHVEAKGVICDLQNEKGYDLNRRIEQWALQYVQELNVSISHKFIIQAIQLIGVDRINLEQEFYKLYCFCKKNPVVSEASLLDLLVYQPTSVVWQLAEAILRKDQGHCFAILAGLKKQELSDAVILATLRTQFQNYLVIKYNRPLSQEDKTALLGNMNPWAYEKQKKSLESIESAFLLKMLYYIHEADFEFKTSASSDQILWNMIAKMFSEKLC